ncbi:protein asteroid homolog 1-like [Corticium candelabrum]|uniref:protein asteroid homolog 1-like n=1 Tax=Corticium candelabrum TaxID=121492 RepID=UPI002E26B461|nr:protein asteroid homolog 1-like [Corticium candelabrum]
MQYDGQYLEYYQLVRDFFSILKKNEIEAIVVLDGVDEDDMKLPTLRQRLLRNIWAVQRQDDMTPFFALDVFRHAATDSGVELKMCDYEGDGVAAQLANSLRCPVISSDSDFYVLADVVIPLETFKWEKNEGLISCNIYRRDKFLRHINLSDEFLPLLAVLLGNDLTNEEQLKPLHKIITQNVTLTSTQSNRRHGLISAVIKWLTKYPNYEIAEVDLLATLRTGHEKFALILEKSRSSPRSFADCGLKMVDGSVVPDWVIKSFQMLKFSMVALQAASCGRIRLRVQMEDMSSPSSHTCSRPIRQVMYAILFRATTYSQSKVIETGRADGCVALKDYHVEIPMSDNICELAEIQSLSCQKRLGILLSALGCDTDEFQKVDEDWRLPAAALCYWSHLKTTSHKAVYAVIFSFVSCYLAFNQQTRYSSDSLLIQKYDLALSHEFSQFQSVLHYTIMLDSVLNFPLPDFNVARLFDGRLSHYAASKYDTYKKFVEASGDSKMFTDICQLLGRQPGGSHFKHDTRKKEKRKKTIHVNPTTTGHASGSRFTSLELEHSNDSDVEVAVDLTASASPKNVEKQREEDEAQTQHENDDDKANEWTTVTVKKQAGKKQQDW